MALYPYTHRDIFPEPNDVAEDRAYTEKQVYGDKTPKEQTVCAIPETISVATDRELVKEVARIVLAGQKFDVSERVTLEGFVRRYHIRPLVVGEVVRYPGGTAEYTIKAVDNGVAWIKNNKGDGSDFPSADYYSTRVSKLVRV